MSNCIAKQNSCCIMLPFFFFAFFFPLGEIQFHFELVKTNKQTNVFSELVQFLRKTHYSLTAERQLGNTIQKLGKISNY